MFNFQKEVVLNSLDKVEVITPKNGGLGTPTIDKKLRIHGGGEYRDKYIVDHKIYKTKAISGNLFKLEIDFDQAGDLATGGAHVQFLIELGLDNDYRGDYGSALWYFRKPLLVDVMLTGTPATDVIKLADALNAAIPVEYKFVTVSTSSNKVIVEGVDSYQKVRKVIVSKFVCEDRCAGSSEEVELPYDYNMAELVAATGFITYTPNSVEFGTYEYLIHNLRLPTYENLRFTSPNEVEMPIKGAKYTQYSFAYSVPRVGFGGLSVAGQAVQSTTLHTFYVLESLAETFETKLAELNASFKTADGDIITIQRGTQNNITVLPDAYASSQDLSTAAEVANLSKKVTAVEGKNSEQDSAIAAKADSSNVYTKSETYQKSEVYSKTESDAKFQTKA